MRISRSDYRTKEEIKAHLHAHDHNTIYLIMIKLKPPVYYHEPSEEAPEHQTYAHPSAQPGDVSRHTPVNSGFTFVDAFYTYKILMAVGVSKANPTWDIIDPIVKTFIPMSLFLLYFISLWWIYSSYSLFSLLTVVYTTQSIKTETCLSKLFVSRILQMQFLSSWK